MGIKCERQDEHSIGLSEGISLSRAHVTHAHSLARPLTHRYGEYEEELSVAYAAAIGSVAGVGPESVSIVLHERCIKPPPPP